MKKIIEMLLNYVEPDDEITKSDLGLSSFDLVCLGDDIFNEFGVKFTADDFRAYNTVGKLSSYIEAHAV